MDENHLCYVHFFSTIVSAHLVLFIFLSRLFTIAVNIFPIRFVFLFHHLYQCDHNTTSKCEMDRVISKQVAISFVTFFHAHNFVCNIFL